MTKAEIFQASLNMDVETTATYTLTEKPGPFYSALLSANLSQARPGVKYSVLRSGDQVTVHCYVKEENP